MSVIAGHARQTGAGAERPTSESGRMELSTHRFEAALILAGGHAKAAAEVAV